MFLLGFFVGDAVGMFLIILWRWWLDRTDPVLTMRLSDLVESQEGEADPLWSDPQRFLDRARFGLDPYFQVRPVQGEDESSNRVNT